MFRSGYPWLGPDLLMLVAGITSSVVVRNDSSYCLPYRVDPPGGFQGPSRERCDKDSFTRFRTEPKGRSISTFNLVGGQLIA